MLFRDLAGDPFFVDTRAVDRVIVDFGGVCNDDAGIIFLFGSRLVLFFTSSTMNNSFVCSSRERCVLMSGM